MAKFYGPVGYAVTRETAPSVWTEEVVERFYKGDVIRRTGRWQSGEHLNDNRDISQEISIVADPYAYEHFIQIRYVTWMGVKWKVNSADPQKPRIILSLGGIYNGEEQD